MQITTIGIDLAKTVFQIHAVDADGATVIRKRLRRAEVLLFFAGLEPCLIGMEACATSHYWARELAKSGHTVKLMPPAYVKPYVKRGENDATDAEAICEAVTRPNMRFVPVRRVSGRCGARPWRRPRWVCRDASPPPCPRRVSGEGLPRRETGLIGELLS
jgi:transposase